MRMLTAVLLFLAACSGQGSGGEWPSLAYRPGEARSAGCCGETVAATPAPPDPEAAPEATATLLPVPDLDQLAARLAKAETAWAVQREKTAEAVAAAGRAAAGDVQWASAELELSRLERNAAEFLAVANGIGVVTSPERAVALREAALAAHARHLAAFTAMRADIPR